MWRVAPAFWQLLSVELGAKRLPRKNTIPHLSKDFNSRQLKSIFFFADELVIFVVLAVL